MGNSTDTIIVILGVCVGVILLGTLVLKFITKVYMPFTDERDYLLMEMSRSHGNTYVHYKHELHRLYLAQIPFVGKKLAESHKMRETKRQERRKRKKKK